MKRIYWILTSISLYSLLSCSNGAKDTREYQTVKTDTVVSAGGQTSLQYPGKVKAAQDISLAFRVSGTIQKISSFPQLFYPLVTRQFFCDFHEKSEDFCVS